MSTSKLKLAIGISQLTKGRSTDDFVYQKATGELIQGGYAAIEALKETYAPFTENKHEPRCLSCWETDDGWEMMGEAMLFGDLQAPGEKDQIHADANGRKWDLAIPSSFHFTYVKDPDARHDGIRLAKSVIYSDSFPAVKEMLKRGMMKPEQLMD